MRDPLETVPLAFGRGQAPRDLMADPSDDTVPYTPIRESWWHRLVRWLRGVR